jgi:hypothetical protein
MNWREENLAAAAWLRRLASIFKSPRRDPLEEELQNLVWRRRKAEPEQAVDKLHGDRT